MHPAAVRSDRPLHSSIPPIPPGSSLLHQQHHKSQQHNCVYVPATNLQQCTSNLQTSAVYSAPQRGDHVINSQDKNKWHTKGKQPRIHHQQYCHQQQILTYPKPLLLYDQQRSTVPPPQPTSSFLVASSSFTQHVPYQNDHYNNSGLAIIPQPYYKPPEVQTFCVVQDRPLQRQQQQQQHHNSYYNINGVNNCGLQATNTFTNFQMPNAGEYASVATFANNQVPAVQSTPIFSTMSPLGAGELQRDRVPPSSMEFPKSAENKFGMTSARITMSSRMENVDWLPPKTSNNVLGGLFSSTKSTPISATDESAKSFKQCEAKAVDERYSDESSTSFDFTIEAEKMVSALCSTVSSHDLAGKDEEKNKHRDASVAFGDAGDDVSNKSAWFSDIYSDYETSTTSGKSVGTQTLGAGNINRQQFPELIRKTAYWGCQEAEKILSSSRYFRDEKHTWLANISSATKIAITKSSTCFPIFAGDQIFVHDLINSLVRISNGWLVLDNYLNKQHYPNLNDKYDHELVRCFQNWECSTYDLLQNIIETYMKLEETGVSSGTEQRSETTTSSFPGDVSMYTSFDLFEPSASKANQKKVHEKQNSQLCGAQASNLQNFQYCGSGRTSQKDVKMRSRWTITESLNSGFDGSKSFPDISSEHSDMSISGNKFRTRGNTPASAKHTSSKQTVNAEFCHLRNKILENSNFNTAKHWEQKKKEMHFENKLFPSSETITKIKVIGTENCEINQLNCLSAPSNVFDNTSGGQQNYFGKVGATSCQAPLYTNGKSYHESDSPKSLKTGNRTTAFIDPMYANRTSDPMEMSAIPRNRMTLLSQIEPTPFTDGRPTQEISANLSAWFASMESVSVGSSPVANLDVKVNEPFPRFSPHRSEMTRSLMDLTRQLQLDGNRQLLSLQNMQSIQSAPWNASNLINGRASARQYHGPDEYDSSEDVRVYMKPGSYNVPKKRHQRRLNRRQESSSVSRNAQRHSNRDKTSIPRSTSSLPTPKASDTTNEDSDLGIKNLLQSNLVDTSPTVSLDETPRSLKEDNNQSSSQDCFQDVTWKNACASAEILLEALNTNETSQRYGCKDEKSNRESELLPPQKSYQRKRSKSHKQRSENDCDASSYEASGDDSGKTSGRCRLHHSIA